MPYSNKHMPESTEAVPQPSFTSSTYRAIAENGPLIPTGDRPLSEQPNIQTFLNTTTEGPVSENLLYRLLTLAELYIEHQLPEKQLSGLCLGYFLKTDDTSKFYYVSWGAIPNEVIKVDEFSDFEGADEIIDLTNLAALINDEIIKRTKDTIQDNQNIEVLILAYFSAADRLLNEVAPNFPEGSMPQVFSLSNPSDISFTSGSNVTIPINRSINLGSLLMSIDSSSIKFSTIKLRAAALTCSQHDSGTWTTISGHPKCSPVKS